MRGLVIPLFYAAPASALGGTVFNPPLRAWVYAEDRTAGFPVMDWVGLSVTQGRWDTQSKATLTVPASTYWLDQAALALSTPAYAARLSMDVYWQDMSTPIFSGPVVNVKEVSTARSRLLTFSFPHFMRHFLGRRVILSTSTTGAKFDLGSLAADLALSTVIRQNGFHSASTLKPIGYPATRTDFDDWACTCNAASGSHGSSVNPDFSWGRRLLEEADKLADQFTMFYGLTEVSAATWEIDVAAAYQANDYTDEVWLDLRRGTLSEFSREVDYDAIENVVALKVTGGGAVAWDWDATANAGWGAYEGVYAGDEFDATAASSEADYAVDRFKSGSTTIGGVLVDQPGATFGVDYGRRSLVTLGSPASGYSATKVVVGSEIRASGRRISASVVIGNPPLGWDKSLTEGAGAPMGGGRGLGSRFKVANP